MCGCRAIFFLPGRVRRVKMRAALRIGSGGVRRIVARLAGPDGDGGLAEWQLSVGAASDPGPRLAWRTAMQRLCLPVTSGFDRDDFEGSISCATSPMGFEFARVTASPLEISGDYPDQEAALWLAVQLRGNAIVETVERNIALVPGMILYGPTGAPASMRMITKFDALFIKVPRVALGERLLASIGMRIGLVAPEDGAATVFFGLLKATAEVLADLDTTMLRPIELAVTEFLVTCLGSAEYRSALGTDSLLHVLCQTIEQRLPDPHLGLRQIADEYGISTRQVQDLFAAGSDNLDSFNAYLRQRRLERARADLANPFHDQLSISEICYRWGFNSTQYFSRTFRKRYGISPREYRARAARLPEARK